MSLARPLACAAVALAAAGCGSSSSGSGVNAPDIGAARTFKLQGFQPSPPVAHGTPHIKAIQAKCLPITVTDPQGRPANFTPWFGALAHAIFFRAKSLDYFHTHVCGVAAPNCASLAGQPKITGHSNTPGKLTVGVLLPTSGTWRLFVQCRVNGHVLTAPFTLHVK